MCGCACVLCSFPEFSCAQQFHFLSDWPSCPSFPIFFLFWKKVLLQYILDVQNLVSRSSSTRHVHRKVLQKLLWKKFFHISHMLYTWPVHIRQESWYIRTWPLSDHSLPVIGAIKTADKNHENTKCSESPSSLKWSVTGWQFTRIMGDCEARPYMNCCLYAIHPPTETPANSKWTFQWSFWNIALIWQKAIMDSASVNVKHNIIYKDLLKAKAKNTIQQQVRLLCLQSWRQTPLSQGHEVKITAVRHQFSFMLLCPEKLVRKVRL